MGPWQAERPRYWGLSICFSNSRVAASNWLSRPVSPTGLSTAISTGRGFISMDAPLAVVTRVAGRRSTLLSNQRGVAGVDDPAGRRLAHHLAQLQGAVAFGEIFRVGERVPPRS